ncbi:uncharacterized protein LOC132193812 [Neocloeon triangulifer]|uniref:uncharacterized protein LOC132193812 n=1 Tax=Neocloeon triangulifer TaxID=2078957 RepID=UPI00286EBD1C|nr:uncharacterized protein LOC132193812 [Neocloeon triangulifer]
MELMEDGNLMDRVQILLQRDLGYYEEHHTVLQENLCLGAVGGPFDFPRYASFAAVKLVKWWEEEFFSCFHHPSGLIETRIHTKEELDVKKLPSAEFVEMVQQSAEKLLEHLHTLSQESLDHADLAVLTATLGAAALCKNALWCFNEQLKKDAKSLSLHQASRLMQEMVEALAERLLDLHCRLLALYVLQDADSLNWESQHSFFEGQRGSFTIQMWWFYMQGAREDLWNTVPPKTAQRVLAGMLNESLTILTARYSQAKPSLARSPLIVTDIGNILICVRHLLPSICTSGSELLGLVGPGSNKAARDVHAKCHDLLCTLLIRGCPLATLYKVFRRGADAAPLFLPRPVSPATWFVLVAPKLFPGDPPRGDMHSLNDNTAVAVELSVLCAQPEASWPLLVKVLLMRNYVATTILLRHLLKADIQYQDAVHSSVEGCGGFLCGATAGCWVEGSQLTPSQVLSALVQIIVVICGDPEGGGMRALHVAFSALLQQDGMDWSCLDKRQMWAEQRRPAWLSALVNLIKDCLGPSMASWATSVDNIFQGLQQIGDTISVGVVLMAKLLDDILPADVSPFGGQTLMQLIGAAVYAELVKSGADAPLRLAEEWCGLDTDLFREEVAAVVVAAQERAAELEEDLAEQDSGSEVIEELPQIAEVLVSRLLLTSSGRTSVKIVFKFIQHNLAWLMGELGAQESRTAAPPVHVPAAKPAPHPLLHAMFHIGGSRAFDELLTGAWQLNWVSLLHTELGISKTQMAQQLTRRAEFREPHFLNEHDAKVVAILSTIFGVDPN